MSKLTAVCAFCGRDIRDGKEESGYTGVGPDWSDNGDYGCDANPITDEDGVGGHMTQEEVDEVLRVVLLDVAAYRAVMPHVRDKLYGEDRT